MSAQGGSETRVLVSHYSKRVCGPRAALDSRQRAGERRRRGTDGSQPYGWQSELQTPPNWWLLAVESAAVGAADASGRLEEPEPAGRSPARVCEQRLERSTLSGHSSGCPSSSPLEALADRPYLVKNRAQYVLFLNVSRRGAHRAAEAAQCLDS